MVVFAAMKKRKIWLCFFPLHNRHDTLASQCSNFNERVLLYCMILAMRYSNRFLVDHDDQHNT